VTEVRLREVIESDVGVFFEHQRDPAATEMAAFPARDRDAHVAHWAKITRDPANTTRTVLADDQVAGNIASFPVAGERHIGYWIGREFWGKGVATAAVAQLVKVVTARPMFARVAAANPASVRVLEKCGFAEIGRHRSSIAPGEPEVDEIIYRLD